MAKPSDRVAEVWHSHPKWTLATLAAGVAVLSGIIPILLAVFHFFATHDELETHKKHDETVAAWASLQGIRTEMVGMRNRVNDCDIMKQRKQPLSDLEQRACAQYTDEFDNAVQRFKAAQITAKATTKE